MNDKIFRWQDANLEKINTYVETHNIFIVLQDKRDKTFAQIKFMYVLLEEFAREFYGETDKETIEELKYTLYQDFCEKNNVEVYRTKTASITEMKMFLDWLIKYMAQNFGITIALELVEESFLNSWIYANTCARKCCVCGASNASIHHTKRIGIGQDRSKVDHTKFKVIALCDYGKNCHKEEHITGKLLKNNGLHGVQLSKYDFERLGIRGTYEEGD